MWKSPLVAFSSGGRSRGDAGVRYLFCWAFPLTCCRFSLPLPLSLSLLVSHPFSLSISFTLSLLPSPCRSHFLTLNLARSRSLTPSHSHSGSLSLWFCHSLFRSLAHWLLSLKATQTRQSALLLFGFALALPYALTQPLIRRRTNPLTRSLMHSFK